MVAPAALVAEIPHLRRFARALARDPGEADDLAQATLQRALERLDALREPNRLRSWLFRIAYTIHVNERVRRARGPSLLDPQDESLAPGIDGGQEGRIEALSALDALSLLPSELRAAIALTAVEGLAYREAAEALDIPVGTLMSRLHRARLRLRELMGQTAAERRAPPRLRRVK